MLCAGFGKGALCSILCGMFTDTLLTRPSACKAVELSFTESALATKLLTKPFVQGIQRGCRYGAQLGIKMGGTGCSEPPPPAGGAAERRALATLHRGRPHGAMLTDMAASASQACVAAFGPVGGAPGVYTRQT